MLGKKIRKGGVLGKAEARWLEEEKGSRSRIGELALNKERKNTVESGLRGGHSWENGESFKILVVGGGVRKSRGG